MREELREQILGNKWFVLTLVLILGLILFSVMAKVISNTTYKKKTGISRAGQRRITTTKFIGGYDWNSLNRLKMSEMEKILTKISFIKLSIESSMINGNPVIKPKGPLHEYIRYVDRFYKESGDNASVPLFFALRIADMQKNGSPPQAIQGYKVLVMQKLREVGLTK